MREKELRIALVCFGGVSLAIYMHGISKELLKLVRASRALHAIADRTMRARASFFDNADAADPEFDTEGIYFELLRDIGRTLELRVIVDIIAGASAGGINGTMLARALCHDLPMADLRDLWLDNADVGVLLAPEARAGAWSKWILKPFIWGAAASGLLESIRDREVRKNLSLFVRSRWFKPPLDGPRMAELMYDAVTTMGAPRNAGSSLLPAAQRLELYVTLTDYHGYQVPVQIHDPPLIHEREHHHILHFRYRRKPDGEVESDFDLANAPALAFAARATSSFPGAFPPAQIAEVDEVAARRGDTWPRRAEFFARNFVGHLQAGVDPTTATFIDGSVLNNRPFREAISAIHGRPAYRQVDRRLVYIDPDPASPASPSQRAVPGFFATLKGAMSDIPRSQPVTDELAWVADFNDRVRRLRAIIDGARPYISSFVNHIVSAPHDQRISADQIRAWREQVNTQVAFDAGFAYQGYVRLKLASVRTFISQLIIDMRDVPRRSPLARSIVEIVDAWAIAAGYVYSESDDASLRQGSLRQEAVSSINQESVRRESTGSEVTARWARLFLAFDLDYRKRRLHFLIEGLNRLYQLTDRDRTRAPDQAAINQLKRAFYERLEALRFREEAANFSAATRALVGEIFSAAPSAQEAKHLRDYSQQFVKGKTEEIHRLVDRLAAEIDLNASTRDVDLLLAELDPDRWPAEARRDVLVNYLGFPFWDVLTLSVADARETGELNEILVDRISPQDARTLEGFNGAQSLKGTGFGHFAAFLSRAYRENDYLLGRLHATDRLIDIVCDCAGIGASDERIDVLALKKRAFTRILDVEERYLSESGDLIAALRQCIAGIGRHSVGLDTK